MSMTFTKLFTSITESTVWCEPDKVRLVWITMLAMADRRGRVWGSIPGLANRARVPTEDCREALERFLAPDPDSRTKAFEGRRIEEIEGGWRLLNYEKYRAIRDSESIKESKRAYMAKRREVEKGIHNGTQLPSVELGRDNAEAEAEAYKNKSRADALPVWLDKEAWESWRAYRAELRKPLKPSTISRQLKFLSEHQGSHSAIIEQSIRQGWTGLFPLGDSRGPSKKLSASERVRLATEKQAEDERKLIP